MALVGHHGAGKTTLAEALLGVTGAVPRPGRSRRAPRSATSSPRRSPASSRSRWPSPPSPWTASRSTCSTPRATPTSRPSCAAALDVADLAVVVVSAVRRCPGPDRGRLAGGGRPGPAPGDRDQQARPGAGRLRPDAGRGRAGLRGRRRPGRAAGRVRGAEFHGVVDLLDDTATCTTVGEAPPVTGRHRADPRRAGDEEHEVHEQLVEGIVVGDDDLMARYLDGETIPRRRARGQPGRRGGVGRRVPGPVLLGAHRGGHRPSGPPPGRARPRPRQPARRSWSTRARRPPRSAATRPGRRCSGCVKTFSDQHAGQALAVQGGLGHHHAPTPCSPTPGPGPTSACTSWSRCGATRRSPVSEAVAGDFVAVPRLNDVRTGDTLAPKGTPVVIPVAEPEPARSPGGRAAGLAGRRRQAHVGPPPPVRGGRRPGRRTQSTRPTRPCSGCRARSTWR